MFAVSKKRGAAVIVALLGVVLLIGGCSKLPGGGDGAVGVEDASNGTSATDNSDTGGATAKPKADTDGNVTVDGGGVHVKINGDDVVVKIDDDGKVNVDGAKSPADVDVCANISGKQADMPDGYMPSGPAAKPSLTTGLFNCGKIADVIASKAKQHAGASSDQLQKLIQGEVNKSLQNAGVK